MSTHDASSTYSIDSSTTRMSMYNIIACTITHTHHTCSSTHIQLQALEKQHVDLYTNSNPEHHSPEVSITDDHELCVP